MKKLLKQERGVSLISLAAAVIVIGIITSMLLYSVKDTNDIDKLTKLYTDIDNLEDKISNYYSVYGKIPAIPVSKLGGVNEKIAAISSAQGADSPIGANDLGDYLVIDLVAIENLTLNYGKDYEKFKNLTGSGNSIGDNTDLYVINENSHNIFYLNGIEIEEGNKSFKYYTNKDKDTKKVDLRFVEGVRIPDGYKYVSENKSNGIIIDNIENPGNQYRWINIDKKIKGIFELENANQISGLNDQDKIKFVESINEYHGYYFSEDDNITPNVLYIEVNENDINSWSATYDKEGNYKDQNGDTAYIPQGFQVCKLTSMNTIEDGLVIRNGEVGKGNEKYVWVKVPEGALEHDEDEDIDTAHTLEEIENDLKEYAKTYREEGYLDTYYDGCMGGTSSTEEYNELRNKMYQSIKDKGGFWVSQDEIGEEKCSDAFNSVHVSIGDRTKSLMFGIQWDLMCKFLEEKSSDESNTEILKIKNLVQNPEITLESKSTNSASLANGNVTVLRGGDSIEKRSTIPYTTLTYYRTTIF